MKRLMIPGLSLLVLVGSLSVQAEPGANAPVVEGNTKFAVELYQQLRAEKGNLFFSPYSISSALGMTYLGARGETADEMQKVLHFPETDALNTGFLALNNDINGMPKDKRGYQLSVANALWGQNGYPWNKDFLATTKKFYDAGVNDVDFMVDTEKARVTINEWVEKKTNDKIKDLLEKGVLTSDTRMVLTNAIYFKGDWASQFKKDRTRPTAFKVSTTESRETPLMYQSGKYAYGEDADVQVLKLPYTGKELEMVVILPKKVDGLAAIEDKLTPQTLAGWISRTRERSMDMVGLPKFKSENKFKLRDTLMKMGMVKAFTTADFTGIATKERLQIGAVIHQSFIDVNEQGTEAAAATAVEIRTTSAALNPDPRFVADHPFLYLIRDTRNGSVLFLGRFVRPE